MTLPEFTLKNLNYFAKDTLVAHLGIEFLELGEGFVKAKMPVDTRTHQPQGVLHGGASAALAETLGSVGSAFYLDLEKHYPVGVELNANHLRAVASGYVIGTATALHIGRRTHVWDIKIVDEADRLVCASRITLMIVEV